MTKIKQNDSKHILDSSLLEALDSSLLEALTGSNPHWSDQVYIIPATSLYVLGHEDQTGSSIVVLGNRSITSKK